MASSGRLRTKQLVGACLAAILALSFIALAASQSRSDDTGVRPKNILLLFSYGQNFQPWVTWSREIRKELNSQSPWPLNFQEHSLVTALTGDDAAEGQFVAFLEALYAPAPPDLILAFGAPAARFVQQYRKGLFPQTPMLLAAVERRRVTPSLLSEQDVLAGTQVDHGVLVKNILQLLPKTRTIAMVIGNSPAEQFWVREVKRELEPLLGDRVELRFYNEKRFDEILEDVANLPPDSVIFFQQLMVDGAGAIYGDKDPLTRISKVANAPIFALDQTYFDGRIVGGPMSSPAEGAQSTAAVAIRMLDGEKPDTIHVPPIAFSAPEYDWRQLRRWNISESRLAPGSEVLFREPKIWEKYPLQISLVLAVTLMQAGLIWALLHERYRRQTAETQSRQRMAELAHANRFSTAGELAALVAHEINQPLGAILSNAEGAAILLKSSSPDIAQLTEIVGDIQRNDERASEVIRRMHSLLKKAPFELRNIDLNVLAQETADFLVPLVRGRNVELLSVLEPGSLPVLGDHVQLQQVILNFVMNGIDAMKEVSTKDWIIVIRTWRAGDFAELSVSDRGSGIPADKLNRVFEPFFTTKAEGLGMGLAIARTIMESHNGHIDAENRDNGGATFSMRLPLTRQAAFGTN